MSEPNAGDQPRIAILDDNTANQIAAGEVVERPASVVKELVENSIDAGSSQIQVELIDAGKTLIRVTDDGSGMGRADAILSLQRHATSKIRSSEDLHIVRTMGFRGEAVPSIASVCRMSISTYAGVEDAGTQLRVTGSAIEWVHDCPLRPGTVVTVEDLFYNVPARLKFLKSNSTELNHIVELVQRVSLARPDISFRLFHQDHEIYGSDGAGSIQSVCAQVFGREAQRHLIQLDYASLAGIHVGGYIGTAQAMRANRSGQHLFVNQRFVRDRIMVRALDEGFGAVQTVHGRHYPIAVLLLDIDPSQVDVNVSPTKTEVRFLREGDIFSAVYRAIEDALVGRGGLAPNVSERGSRQAEPLPQAPAMFSVPSFPPVSVRRDDVPVSVAVTAAATAIADTWTGGNGARLPSTAIESDPFEDQGSSAFNDPAQRTAKPIADMLDVDQISRGSRFSQLKSMRVLAQTRNTYILVQSDDALLVIDQHIAHERVLYERLVNRQTGGATAMQRLVLPITLELGRREALMVTSKLEELAQAGFEIEAFGGDSFLVRAVPAQLVQKKSVEPTLRAIIDEMLEKSVSRKLMVPAEEVLITASCKMAVKAGDPLSFHEMEALVADLMACKNPYTCPHGRPVIVELANSYLDRTFGRA